MPRIARLIVKEEEAVYNVMSRTALDGYVMGDVEDFGYAENQISARNGREDFLQSHFPGFSFRH